jgi:hypothetical protein
MGMVLDAARLEKALAEIQKNPKDPNHVGALIELIRPIIALTRERFPQHLGEDLEQEIRLFIIKRADYIARTFFEGKIKNPTNYFFTVCRNSAINHMKKETKNDDRLIPLDDLKTAPIYKGDQTRKQRIVEQIREDMLKWCRIRYKDQPKLSKRAEKFVMVMMAGERPSFTTAKLKSFAQTDQQAAKDVYSVVLIKLREMASEHIEELLS